MILFPDSDTMKKYAFLTLLLALAACGAKDGMQSCRVREDGVANLGTIKEIDGPVTVKLLARNNYPDTLYPIQTYTQCGCTAAQSSREPVAPGADEVLEVTYNPAYRPGPILQEVQVQYRNSPVKLRSFTLQGTVIGYNHPIEEDRPYAMGEGLYMSHKVLSFGNMAPRQTRDMFFRHGNGNRKKADIRFEVPAEWQPYLRLRQPGRMKADERDTLHVKFTMPEGIDTVAFDIQPFVNGVPTPETVGVRAVRR